MMKTDEAYDYSVIIHGLNVPFRTTFSGMCSLMKQFNKKSEMDKILIEAIENGLPFNNKLIKLSKISSKTRKPKKPVSKKREKNG